MLPDSSLRLEQNFPSTLATSNSGITYSAAAPWNKGSLKGKCILLNDNVVRYFIHRDRSVAFLASVMLMIQKKHFSFNLERKTMVLTP